jgi:TRAP transporter TAXI family solute receptor
MRDARAWLSWSGAHEAVAHRAQRHGVAVPSKAQPYTTLMTRPPCIPFGLMGVSVVVLLALVGCTQPAEPALPTPIKIWTSTAGGSYHQFGEGLARSLASRLPGVAATVITSGGSIDNVEALRQRTADVAVALGDVVYLAHLEDSRLGAASRGRLRGIAVLYRSAVHFVVPRNSSVRRVGDLAGARIGVLTGTLALQRQRTTQVLLEAHGLEPSAYQISPLTLDEVRTGFRNGDLQAGVFATLPPNPLLADDSANLHLIRPDPSAVERAREQYPFFQPMTIPAGTHPHQPTPIETVGIDNLLVCREDLDSELVYRLTKTFVESLPEFAKSIPSVSLPGPDLASATPIPLHRGAARYYRERELLMY